jgi:LmbE family N-acetylglucosaminyl deacetylase
MPVDVLAIAAHPDDIELTCAGTLLSLKGERARLSGSWT